MEFTYNAYGALVNLLRNNGYSFADYHNFALFPRVVILRHDVDYSLEKALELARFEKSIGIQSTYFLLLSSDLYNIASKKSLNYINEIIGLGHEIGLHFDSKGSENNVRNIGYYNIYCFNASTIKRFN